MGRLFFRLGAVGLLLALMKAHPLRGENASSSSGCLAADRDQ